MSKGWGKEDIGCGGRSFFLGGKNKLKSNIWENVYCEYFNVIVYFVHDNRKLTYRIIKFVCSGKNLWLLTFTDHWFFPILHFSPTHRSPTGGRFFQGQSHEQIWSLFHNDSQTSPSEAVTYVAWVGHPTQAAGISVVTMAWDWEWGSWWLVKAGQVDLMRNHLLSTCSLVCGVWRWSWRQWLTSSDPRSSVTAHSSILLCTTQQGT